MLDANSLCVFLIFQVLTQVSTSNSWQPDFYINITKIESRVLLILKYNSVFGISWWFKKDVFLHFTVHHYVAN